MYTHTYIYVHVCINICTYMTMLCVCVCVHLCALSINYNAIKHMFIIRCCIMASLLLEKHFTRIGCLDCRCKYLFCICLACICANIFYLKNIFIFLEKRTKNIKKEESFIFVDFFIFRPPVIINIFSLLK